MKRIFVSAMLASAVAVASAADFFSTEKSESLFDLGVRVGINTSNRTVGSGHLPSYNVQSWGTGFEAGVVADLNIRDYISIQPGAFFESRSSNYTFITTPGDYVSFDSYNSQAGHLRTYSLTIPILASVHFNVTDDIRWDVELGPYVSFLLGKNMNNKVSYSSDPTAGALFDSTPSSVDFGFKMGTGLRILGHYYVGVHYEAGMVDAWKNIKVDNMKYVYGGKTKAWVFTIGYNF